MPATYEPIATTTLSTVASTITFSSIPNTYTDLRLVVVAQDSSPSAGQENIYMTYNSDTATNYSITYLQGDGSTATSGRLSTQANIRLLLSAVRSGSSAFGLGTVDIFSYAGSTNKTSLITGQSDSNGSGYVQRIVGLWRSASAITSITLTAENTFKANTTATLYGIKAA